jgi:hypothetical protein
MGRVQAMMVGAAVALATAAPLAGCGGGNDDSGALAPKGFSKTETADFSVALPSGWKVDKLDEPGGLAIEARPDGTDINRPQLRVASSRDYKDDINAAVKATEAEIPIRRPGAQRVVSKTVDVPGAADARRVEWTVPAGGGLEPAWIVTVLALTGDHTLVNLSVGVAQNQMGSARVDDVVDSLRIG